MADLLHNINSIASKRGKKKKNPSHLLPMNKLITWYSTYFILSRYSKWSYLVDSQAHVKPTINIMKYLLKGLLLNVASVKLKIYIASSNFPIIIDLERNILFPIISY